MVVWWKPSLALDASPSPDFLSRACPKVAVAQTAAGARRPPLLVLSSSAPRPHPHHRPRIQSASPASTYHSPRARPRPHRRSSSSIRLTQPRRRRSTSVPFACRRWCDDGERSDRSTSFFSHDISLFPLDPDPPVCYLIFPIATSADLDPTLDLLQA